MLAGMNQAESISGGTHQITFAAVKILFPCPLDGQLFGGNTVLIGFVPQKCAVGRL
jgi:hypothetical protein